MSARAALSSSGTAFMLLLSLAGGAQAQQETPQQAQAQQAPARVGRIATVQGEVRRLDAQANQWLQVSRNQPVLQGERLAVGAGGSADLQIGASTLRLAGDTEIEAVQLDDQRLQFALLRGSIALRLNAEEAASDFEILAGPTRWQALRDGAYRIDQRIDARGDVSSGSTWRGLLRATTPDIVLTVEPGQRLELPAGAGNAAAQWTQPLDDAFAAAFLREAEIAGGGTPEAVPVQLTGVAELARYGNWQQHPQFGWVWTPMGMAPNWAPYRQGQWVWVQPWGWSWVDAAPWGFAPYHYGRWFPWGNRWYWAPGPLQPRPVRPRHLGPPPLGLPPAGFPPAVQPLPGVPGRGFDPRRAPAPMPLPAMPPPTGWMHRHDGPPGLQGDAWLHRAAPYPGRPGAPPRERISPRPSVAVESAAPPPAPAQPVGPFGGPPRAAVAVAERAPPQAERPAPPGAAPAPMPQTHPFRPAGSVAPQAAAAPPGPAAAPPPRHAQRRADEANAAPGQPMHSADRRHGPRER